MIIEVGPTHTVITENSYILHEGNKEDCKVCNHPKQEVTDG